MKNIGISTTAIFALLFVMTSFASCDDSKETILPEGVTLLTEDETTNLLFMREEEKLARDVYLYLYENYGVNIFNNIASSEQTHMEAVLTVMDKYGVQDPASNELGVFTNTTLQQLYDDLIAQGEASLVAGLTVGAIIEDVDIQDLGNAINTTIKSDIIEMYGMLECGSRNHLRSFSNQLDRQGETYTPQFITQEAYDEIINGGNEQCGL